MALTLTNLIPDVYSALDIVRREQVGMIPAVTLDASASQAAQGQVVRSFFTADAAATDITPGVTPPNDGDQTIGNAQITISKMRRSPFRWTGEEERGVNNNGPGAARIRVDQIAQAMRKLTNEMEADLCALYSRASRAVGAPGATPFATTLGDSAQALKALKDNGYGDQDMQLVIDTTAGANLRTLTNLTRANEAGDTSMLRQGVLMDVHGFAIRESAGINPITSGTGAAYTTNTAGYAIGATSITLITGTGTVLAGDTVTFAGDANRYIVATGVAAPGTIVLAAPGLRRAIPASAVAMTVGAISVRNMAFARGAIVLATRAPAVPEAGDMAMDRTLITDPVSGITFSLAVYPQYYQVQYELSAAWGVAAINPAGIINLLG